jgi:myxalamid-type polyketide synthase MxaB
VLHATADLAQSLQHLHELLAPGGQLILLELTAKQRWLDLTFGLTEGWWRFADTQLRPDYPLLSGEQWQALLQDQGFLQPLLLSPESACNISVLQTVMVAQKPALPTSIVSAVVDEPAAGQDVSVPEAAFGLATHALGRVQAVIKNGGHPRLWLVTQNALAYSQTPMQVPGSVLWGLGRTVMWEYPELHCSCLDLCTATSVGQLFDAIWQADTEDQIILHDGQRLVARLERFTADGQAQSPYPFQAQLKNYGLLDALQLIPAKRKPPGSHQVEVQVRAVGLNFRDVLSALGMLGNFYPKEMGFDGPSKLPLGFECTGTVVAVGSEVIDYAIGDEVIVWLCWGGMASFITVETTAITLKPSQLSFEQAATIPLAFLTAYYGLHELAQLQPGERVLIHAAAGGVGLAAIQIAQQIGAEIFATASLGKWDFLKSMGIKHVMNSRTLEFAEQIHQLTDGKGVDVVLNSLNGEFIAKSFDVLAERGRFVEIGHIKSWDMGQASHYRPLARYFPFNLDDIRQKNPYEIKSLQEKVFGLFAGQAFKPLPYHVFPIQKVSEAFQFMAKAKNIGKVVLSIAKDDGRPTIQTDKRYLIVGGLGGLGLKVAHWLVGQGARQLVLVGRSGAESATAKAEVQALEGLGVTVYVVKADVSQQADVEQLLSPHQAFAPVHGIIHAAGVLDDGILLQQTPERFAKVFAPKVQGSWNLHLYSQTLPLDFFVCFSSITSLLGNGGQSGYAAASAFMDQLVAYRHALGLPALAINWGGWSDVGLAATMSSRWDMINPEQGVALLGYILKQSVPQIGVLPFKWDKFAQGLPVGSDFPVLSQFLNPKATPSLHTNNTLRQQLAQASLEQRDELLREHIRTEIKNNVGVVPTDQQGLFDVGMDSLMSVQLSNRLAASLEVSLPATLTLEFPTVELLSQYLAEHVLGWKQQATVGKIDKDAELENEVMGLSAAELEDSIAKELADLEGLLDD